MKPNIVIVNTKTGTARVFDKPEDVASYMAEFENQKEVDYYVGFPKKFPKLYYYLGIVRLVNKLW